MASPADYVYRHSVVNGITFPPTITQGRIDELKNFPLRLDDLFIVTYPKSGTTWVQQIIKQIRNEGKKVGVKITDAIPWLERTGLILPSGTRAVAMPSPRSFKSHTPYHMMPGGPPHSSCAKYIYVARNPKDVAVSLYYHSRAIKMFEYSGPWDHFFQLFMDGKVESGLWFDHVLEWWKYKDDANVLFLKFEDMKKDLSGAVKTIANFIGVQELRHEEIVEQCTFDSMRLNDAVNYSWRTDRNAGEPPFLRKGVIGDWRNHFTLKQSDKFDTLYAEKMKGTGLDFVFE